MVAFLASRSKYTPLAPMHIFCKKFDARPYKFIYPASQISSPPSPPPPPTPSIPVTPPFHDNDKLDRSSDHTTPGGNL